MKTLHTKLLAGAALAFAAVLAPAQAAINVLDLRARMGGADPGTGRRQGQRLERDECPAGPAPRGSAARA